jgi:ATP-dependent DNA helicase RecG
LSQLHQLRGRIGRGNQPSLCVLVSDVGEGVARERLRTLCHSDDGFLLAEKDLELRGPGDFFGTRQHGLPDFHAANLYQDTRLLKEVQTAVDNILAADPDLNTPPNRRVIQALQSRYQEVFPNIGL